MVGQAAADHPTHTGSEYGRHTFHIPNSYSRRPVADDYLVPGTPAHAALHKPFKDGTLEGGHDGHGEMEADVAARSHEDTAMLYSDHDGGTTEVEEQVGWYEHPSLGPLGRTGVLATFSLLGAAILLPFNTLITPTEYYRELLVHSHSPSAFMSWVLLAYNAATILLGAHAVVSLHKTTPARRIYYSSTFIFLCLLIFTIFTTLPVVATKGAMSDVYLVLLLTFTFAIAGSTAYLQNAVVSLCSIFGGRAMGVMLTGQGLIGVGISIVQLIAAYHNRTRPGPSGSTSMPDSEDAASESATAFFATSTIVMAIACASFIWLARSKVYKATCRDYEISTQSNDTETPAQGRLTAPSSFLSPLIDRLPPASRSNVYQILAIQSKVFVRAMCLFANFAITLSLFPAVTARVKSVAPRSQSWTTPLVFVAIHFLTFNTADMIGRTLPVFRSCIITSERFTIIGTSLRIFFIPLLFACNLHLDEQSSARSLPDWIFFAIIFFFGLSNGLITTSILITGPSSRKLNSDSERATAGAVLSFWLTLGLAAGSIGSFIITALI